MPSLVAVPCFVHARCVSDVMYSCALQTVEELSHISPYISHCSKGIELASLEDLLSCMVGELWR